MPQPLSRMGHLKTKSYGIDACNERPLHMLEAMKIISAAAFAEQWLGNILVGLAPESAMRMAKHLNSLESEAKKTASFEATATVLLGEDMHDLLRSIVKEYRSACKARHPFAHHRYGWAAEDRDILMLIDPRHELLDRALRGSLTPQLQDDGQMSPEQLSAYSESSRKLDETIMCYRLAELQEISARIKVATLNLTQFWQITSKTIKIPPNILSEVSAQLTQRLGAKEA